MRPRPVLTAAARLALGFAAAALIVTACQPSESLSSSPGVSASDESSVGAPSIGPLPSFVGAADLEETIPTEVDGITLQTFSMSGPDFVAGEVDPQFISFLDGLGADIEDVAVAFGFGANADGTQTASVFAFRVGGANAQDLTDEFKDSADAGGDPLVWHTASMGGKTVEVSDPNDDFPTPVVLYATGDVLYFVSSTDPNATEEILAFLP